MSCSCSNYHHLLYFMIFEEVLLLILLLPMMRSRCSRGRSLCFLLFPSNYLFKLFHFACQDGLIDAPLTFQVNHIKQNHLDLKAVQRLRLVCCLLLLLEKLGRYENAKYFRQWMEDLYFYSFGSLLSDPQAFKVIKILLLDCLLSLF